MIFLSFNPMRKPFAQKQPYAHMINGKGGKSNQLFCFAFFRLENCPCPVPLHYQGLDFQPSEKASPFPRKRESRDRDSEQESDKIQA
jgi:hypothetical protein